MKELTAAKRERLYILIEECGELIQAATKVLRFGYESFHPAVQVGTNNLFDLEKEAGHVDNAINLLVHFEDVCPMRIKNHRDVKAKSIVSYFRHQKEPTSGKKASSIGKS